MRIFLSHTSKDQEFAQRLSDSLREAGFDVFSYFDAITPGESLTAKISSAILDSDTIIILVSKETAKNQWISTEIALALGGWSKESTKKRIIPIVIEEGAEIPFFIKDLFYLDLSTPEKYKGNINKLIQTLSAHSTLENDPKIIELSKKKMFEAREAAFTLEKQLYMEEKYLENIYFKKSITLTAFISLIFPIIITAVTHFTKSDTSIIHYYVGVAFLAGWIIPSYISTKLKNHEIKKLSEIKNNLDLIIQHKHQFDSDDEKRVIDNDFPVNEREVS